MNSRIAVVPGSFDPPTLGHLDVIARARDEAERILEADPALDAHPELAEALARRVTQEERAALSKS